MTAFVVEEDVDDVVVARLVDGVPVVGATPLERAYATLALRRCGRSLNEIARQVGTSQRQVSRWVARARDGVPLCPAPGRRPADRCATP